MGARGPIPFPAAKKARTGTLRKDREPDNIANIPPALPTRPEHLSEAAAAIYDELAPTLCTAGLLTQADLRGLVRLCSYQALLTELLTGIDSDNATQQTTGGEAISGDLKAVLALEEKVKGLEDRFGLNPAARSRISVPKVETDGTPNEAADFA